MAGIQRQQLGDFLQAESGALRGANEAQALNISVVIMANGAAAGRDRQQALAVIKAHGFHAHAGRCGKMRDGEP